MATITMLNSYTGKYMTGKIGSFYERNTYKVMDTDNATCGKHYFSTEEEYKKWVENGRIDLKTLEIERKRAEETRAYDDDYDCLDPDDEVRFNFVTQDNRDRTSEASIYSYLNDCEDESELELKMDNLEVENELYHAMKREKEQRRRGLPTTTTLITGSWADECDSDLEEEW